MERAYFIVDRIEEGQALCETERREFCHIALAKIKGEVREGDLLWRDETGAFVVDEKATEARREQVRRLEDSLFEE